MGSKGSLGVVVQPQTLGRQSLSPIPSLCCPLLQLTARPQWNPPKKPHSYSERAPMQAPPFSSRPIRKKLMRKLAETGGGSGEEEIGVNFQEIDTNSSLAPTSCLQDRCPGSSHGIFPPYILSVSSAQTITLTSTSITQLAAPHCPNVHIPPAARQSQLFPHRPLQPPFPGSVPLASPYTPLMHASK